VPTAPMIKAIQKLQTKHPMFNRSPPNFLIQILAK